MSKRTFPPASCLHCGTTHTRGKDYCSDKCRKAAWRARVKEDQSDREQQQCEYAGCLKPVLNKRGGAKFCSNACRQAHYRDHKPVTDTGTPKRATKKRKPVTAKRTRKKSKKSTLLAGVEFLYVEEHLHKDSYEGMTPEEIMTKRLRRHRVYRNDRDGRPYVRPGEYSCTTFSRGFTPGSAFARLQWDDERPFSEGDDFKRSRPYLNRRRGTEKVGNSWEDTKVAFGYWDFDHTHEQYLTETSLKKLWDARFEHEEAERKEREHDPFKEFLGKLDELDGGDSKARYTLGVGETASTTTIKQRYRKLALEHHPDHGGDPEQFRMIQAAYERLTAK